MKCSSALGPIRSVTAHRALPRVSGFALLALLGLAACGAPEAGDDTETAESEIVRFPSGIFPNAVSIAYGQTLPAIPFKATAKFAAVRFRATQGDRITGTVDAGGKKSIVYIVRKQGSAYVNVKAGGQGTDATSNVVSYAIEATDDYYLVFRTVPRADSPFAVTLDSGAASQACPDAGKTLTVNELVASVPSGALARHDSPRLTAHIERRACTYATGCGPVTATYDREVPNLSYKLQSYGNQQWRVIEEVAPTNAGDQVSFTRGKMSGTLANLGSGVPAIPVSGTAGPTCTSIEETHVKVGDNGVSYTEYRIVKNMYSEAMGNFVHSPVGPLPKAPVLDAMSDEDALRRFPRGSSGLTFANTYLQNGTSDGFERSCAPLTSCSAPRKGGKACDMLGRSSVNINGAEITGRDAYRLSTSFGRVDIVDGEGTVTIANTSRKATLRVSENAIQFEFPPMQETWTQYGDVREFSNSTCTFPFSWAGR